MGGPLVGRTCRLVIAWGLHQTMATGRAVIIPLTAAIVIFGAISDGVALPNFAIIRKEFIRTDRPPPHGADPTTVPPACCRWL